jgi:N-succinyldiaminopimelate aminotransferase
MNSRLDLLQPYPFERLRALFADVCPNSAYPPINLSIGEPKHATPEFIKQALTDHLGGLSSYPLTQGTEALRKSLAAWCDRRYGVTLDYAREVLPVNGSREALFAFAQAVVDPAHHRKFVISPNPFYQIYEGAALLAGATPIYLNTTAVNGFDLVWESVPDDVWNKVQLVYLCSPGNPTGRVMRLDSWKHIFDLSEQYGFVIASDECYSEIYFDEAAPPLGALTATKRLNRHHKNLVVFNSLSKRSNVPGLRSGLVAGDAAVLKQFQLYRTYHGSAMNLAVQAASMAAWDDEAHVVENRKRYRETFSAVTPILAPGYAVQAPEAGFYYWLKVPGSDVDFARDLFHQYHVTVLPGTFLAREADGINPGTGYVRIALVASKAECIEAAQRLAAFAKAR